MEQEKNIRVTIRERSAVLREFAETLAKARKGEKIKKHNEISFNSIETLKKFLLQKIGFG